MNLRLLERSEIREDAWNACIREAPVSLAYAMSWYLDAVCAGQWKALVLEDYRAVMPLPYRKKWGISYLAQPPFTQQLGIFGRCSEEEIRAFLQAIPAEYRLLDLQFHTGTPTTLSGIKPRTTYWLNLSAPYPELAAGYSKDARKNLRRLEENAGPCTLKSCSDFGWQISNYRKAYGSLNTVLKDRDYARFRHALDAAAALQQVEAYQLLDSKDNILAGGIFLKSREQWHYVLGAPTQHSEKGGVHGLIDAFIRRHANTPFVLDFEGSEIPSVAYFYAKFGARPVYYYALHINRLPLLLRLLKK